MKLITILFVIYSNLVFAQLIEFSPNEAITKDSMNHNANEIVSVLQNYNIYNISWVDVLQGEIIDEGKINLLFNSIKTYKNDASFTIFVKGEPIKAVKLNENFIEGLNSVKYLVPRSCKDLLEKNPSLLNNDGNYLIDTDGADGAEEPILVFCDMTTDSGGWTNISVNFGTEQALLNYQEFGISNTNPDSLIDGSLINRQSGSGCTDPDIYMRINSNVLSKLGATRVKFVSRNYASGGAACGGIMRDVARTSTTKYNSFNDLQLTTCTGDTGKQWFNFTDSKYLHWSYELSNTDGNPVIANKFVTCGVGRIHLQIKSIMVK